MMILQQYHIIKMLVVASNTPTIHLFDWNTPLTFLKVHMVGENARALWNFLALLSDFYESSWTRSPWGKWGNTHLV